MNSSKKILIVDDETSIVFALESLLSANDYETEKAANGKEALDIIENFKPDLILLDIMMPYIDGLEFSSLIRKHNSLSNTKIIFLTAKGELQDKNEGYNKGCDDYIIKPFSYEELLTKIEYFIGNN